MDPIETKEDESHSTNDEHENREPKEGECDNVASSTTDENYPPFELLKENIYLGNKKKRVNKEIRRMSCDCLYSPEEHDFVGCGDDCLNRLLMIECNNRCPCGESCSNRKFQEGQKTKVEAFKTLKKGWGLRTLEDISAHQFVMEYCGEVMGYEEFETRVEVYDKENRRHYYFMTLRADEIIDATHKGNLSRFINHSCSPNCETQKWTVNGYLRIGFFTIEDIKAGTELTFDYKFQRYGKKAQVCHCETPSCRGIIGGEKHTPLKSIISGRAVSPAPASSPRRNRRRQLAEQFDDKPLEIEIEQLLCGEKGIKSDEQALKLSQFMVRAERPSQRMVILDTLCATQDQNCLRSFLRYQGLSLLWSWMVDLGENSLRLQRKIVQVLKHLPVANLNQVKDSKVLKVISKWAKKPSVSGVPEEETSSSDVDSRGLSPLDLQDDAGKREGDITSSSVDMNLVRDELQNAPKLQDTDEQNIIEEDVFKRKSSEESDNPQMECDSECGAIVESENLNADEYKENDNVFEADEAKTSTVKFSRTGLVADTPGVGESSEEESRWSEDDTASTDSESITDLAAHLLDSWSNLKEVYRIPKKSTVVVKREPESTSGEVEVVTSEPASSSIAPKIPAIPLIEGDLFQKDEFLSKLGERELVERKPFQQDSTVNSNEIPPLMSTCSTPPTSELDEGVHDASKIPIHQRLQMVASSGQALKQYPVWHTKGSKKARKHPYQASGGAPKPGSDKWGARHQVSGKPRFNQPSAGHPNQPTHQGAWHDQGATAFSGSYQLPPGGIPQSSAPAGYPNPAQVQASAPPQSTHFGSSGAPGEHSFFQSQFPAQAGSGPGVGQVSGQIGIQTNPHGYQPMQQPGTQAPPLPPFDPTKPPPNFVPNQRNVPFSNTAQFPSAPSQIPNAPPSYSSTPVVPNVPSYSLPTHQVQAPITSQRTPPFAVEQTPLMPSQHPLHAVSGTPIVSSTVREAGNLDRPMVNFGRATAGGWSADSFSKQHDVPLPPDWKKAFDGEGRAYYYHVVTRQTQWDPPTVDRSPPTPELGYLGDELDSGEEMATAFTPHIRTETMMDVLHSSERKKPKTPSTPPGSPPKSPMVMKYTTAAADTTDVRKGLFSPSSLFQGQHLTTEQRKRRETFRMKLSAVVVNYLNPYHKVDCKIGRITSVDDFKFLARKLTHGVTVKELSRLKDESQLACNDSVKIKTKEYIRNYMQKFGPVYKAS